ncbi:HesB/IscA family protein [Granulicella sibirica]|uniref:Iron binding protein IscA for iron-sulfur cluster assembly n=1 Tax=Granulicella sibirica TaxID=2479048 RepID=A0A4Q0SWF4_9BACT|nr:iron-sulfur cluster assembly accessory protein [Granulicella sibirica]RXH54250.1 Iron binding protein IscA for iron-sulfur cluster assembly [Granulicella sibirica]
MAMVSLQTAAERDAEHAAAAAGEKKDPLAGMTVLTAEGQTPGQKGIQVTLKALKRIRNAMAKENVSPEMGGLRVGITGGGCSGLSYNIRFDSQPRERDRVYSFDQAPLGIDDGSPNIRIFVDPKSFIYLHGMVLDFEETIMRQGFNFINPNSTKSCGCGSSFSS